MLTLVPISKALSRRPFDCGNKDLNDYLRHYALKNDTLSIGKTFIGLADESTVVGYMTLSTAQIEFQNVPEDMRSGLPRYPLPAMRIGKLAVDSSHQSQGIGKWLLTEAFEKAIAVSQSVGLYAVIVDAKDETAKQFYLKYGFIALSEYPLTLLLPLKDIIAAAAS